MRAKETDRTDAQFFKRLFYRSIRVVQVAQFTLPLYPFSATALVRFAELSVWGLTLGAICKKIADIGKKANIGNLFQSRSSLRRKLPQLQIPSFRIC